MIWVSDLERYKKIILWGFVPKVIDKYMDNAKLELYIVDSDKNKLGKIYRNIKIQEFSKLSEIEKSDAAVVILSMNYEREIYQTIRRLGFWGDVYSEDMIVADTVENKEKIDFNNYVLDGTYTIEKHTQIVLQLLKGHNIKNIIVSPGTCNMNFVYSVQNDSFFNVYSCIDERSAGYMACGMAQTTGKPVVLSCTGATASRNYMSALTEGFYSKLPIVVLTSSRDSFMIGNGIDQITDRQHLPADICKFHTEVSEIHNLQEKKYCELSVNRALNMLYMKGGGPVHINLITHFSKDFSVKTLPMCRVIRTIRRKDSFPEITGRTAIYIKPNARIEQKNLYEVIDEFCQRYGAVVIGDHLSNYKGKFFVNISLLADQNKNCDVEFDTIISVGEINRYLNIKSKVTWRISEDGNIIDPFLNLQYHFDMLPEEFFLQYMQEYKIPLERTSLYYFLKEKCHRLYKNIPELPFSNIWVAKCTASLIPKDSVCYFGIYSTLKAWSYFDMESSVKSYSTTGGFGIDGTMSALMGASIVDKSSRLYFGFFGDLSFFYDMNVLGNKHIKRNVRIMIFNNNGGASLLYRNGMPDGERKSNQYIGAKGHYISDSGSTVKAYAEALGYIYLRAESKKEYMNRLNIFMDQNADKPIIYEIVYNRENDFIATDLITNIDIITNEI